MHYTMVILAHLCLTLLSKQEAGLKLWSFLSTHENCLSLHPRLHDEGGLVKD